MEEFERKLGEGFEREFGGGAEDLWGRVDAEEWRRWMQEKGGTRNRFIKDC